MNVRAEPVSWNVKLDPHQGALVLLRALEERGERRGKPLTRARLSAASLKTLWIRETITREWLDQIDEWLLSAGELVWHPLEETIDGEQVKFYPDAEAAGEAAAPGCADDLA